MIEPGDELASGKRKSDIRAHRDHRVGRHPGGVAIAPLGTAETKARSAAATSPVRSAKPMPSITVRTGPSGAKPMKVSTAEVKIQWMPAVDSRLVIATLCTSPFLCGTSADTP